MVSVHPSIYPSTHYRQGSYLDAKRARMNETSFPLEMQAPIRENNYKRSLTNGATPLWGKFLKHFHVPTV